MDYYCLALVIPDCCALKMHSREEQPSNLMVKVCSFIVDSKVRNMTGIRESRPGHW